MTKVTAQPTGVWHLVARREIRVRTRNKTFWVSTVATLVLIVGGIVAWHLFSGRTTVYHVGVTSPTAQQVVAAADTGRHKTRIDTVRFDTRSAAEQGIRSGKVNAALIPSGGRSGGWLLETKTKTDSTLQGYLAQAAQVQAIEHSAKATAAPLASISAAAQLTPVALEHDKVDSQLQWAVTFAFGLLFFMSCQLFGTSIANSVVEEKESRVVEVLISAIPTRALLIGKVVGNALVGLAQMVLFAAAALITAIAVGHVPHLADIARSSGWFLLFYILGFGTVCFLFAGLGALASRTQDVQSSTAPLQMIIVAAYMCGAIGKGAIVTVSSYVPIASTVTMPARLFAGTATWWQVALSATATLVFATLAVYTATRAYRYSVMRTGGRIPLFAALRGSRSAVTGAATR